MKTFLFFKRCIIRSLALTSVVALFMYMIAAISDNISDSLPPSQYLLLLLFALVIGFSQEILFLRRLPLIARIAIHAGALLVSFLVIFTAGGNIKAEIGKILIFAMIFIFVYAVIMSLTMLVLHLTGYYEKNMSYMLGNADQNSKNNSNNKNNYSKRFN